MDAVFVMTLAWWVVVVGVEINEECIAVPHKSNSPTEEEVEVEEEEEEAEEGEEEEEEEEEEG